MTTSSNTASSQVITEYGKQNIFGRETQPQLVEDYTSYPEEAALEEVVITGIELMWINVKY